MFRATRAAMAHRCAAALLVLTLPAARPLAPALAGVEEPDRAGESAAADGSGDSIRIIAASMLPVWLVVILAPDLSAPSGPLTPPGDARTEDPGAAQPTAEPDGRAEVQDAALWSAGTGTVSAAIAP